MGIGSRSEGYGGGGIPHAYLIAPDGMVAWEGHPARLPTDMVKALLRKAKPFHLDPVAKELKSAASAFRKGQLAKAEQLATLIDHRDSKQVIARVKAMRAAWEGHVDKAVAAGAYEDAFSVLRLLKKHFAGGEAAKLAVEREKKLKADPVVKKDLKALKSLTVLAVEWTGVGKSDKKRNALIKKVRKFIDKWQGGKAAQRAGHLLARLERSGKG